MGNRRNGTARVTSNRELDRKWVRPGGIEKQFLR
jgi:hypothetical protein